MNTPVRDAAWEFVKSMAEAGTVSKKLSDVAKGVPSLTMGNTLFQAMATLHGKGKKEHRDFCEGLSRFLSGNPNGTFKDVQALFRDGSSVERMDMTDKGLEWMEWVKLFSAALTPEDDG